MEGLPALLELQAPPQRMSHHLTPRCCSQQPQLPASALKHKRGDVTAAACSELPEHDANVASEVRKTKRAAERAKGICREEGLALLKTSAACWEQLLQTNIGPQTPLPRAQAEMENPSWPPSDPMGSCPATQLPARSTQPGWTSSGKEPREGPFSELLRSIPHPPATHTLQSSKRFP